MLAAEGDRGAGGQPVLVVDAGAADLGAFLQAMRTAGCEHTVLVVAMHSLANSEAATPEWIIVAAMRVWGVRALRQATEIGQVSRVLLQRRDRRTERKALM
eukprot:9507835-Alexandrium_andersonii.AAC.1